MRQELLLLLLLTVPVIELCSDYADTAYETCEYQGQVHNEVKLFTVKCKGSGSPSESAAKRMASTG